MSVPPTAPVIRPRPKATDGTLEFWWGPPTSDGGSAITGYIFNIPGVITDTVGPTVGYYKVTGLVNGDSYTATVLATNAIGNGPAATFRTVQPGLPPSAPQTQSATRTTATNTSVSWTAPSSDGGATVGWNVITCYPLDSSGAVINRNTLGNETSLTIPDLSANTTYTVLVRARNDPGYSPKAVYIAPLVYGPKPQDVSGLRLWLDAADLTTLFSDASGVVPSSLETSQIRVWKDKSGLGHDASGGLVHRLNAGTNDQRYPCVQFVADNTLVTSTFAPSNTNSITVFLVGQMAELVTNNQAFYTSNGLSVLLDTTRGTNLLFNADGGDMLSAPTDAFISMQKANTTNVITTIFSPTYSTNTSARSNIDSFNTSASISLGENSVDVRISELLLWDRALSGGEQGLITSYLQQKWGFPITLPAPVVYLVAADLSDGDTTWLDRSVNGWDASLVAGGTSSKNGSNALVLDGASYWTFGNIGQKSNFTMSVWFKRTAASGVGGAIITEAYTGGNHVNMAIYGGDYGASDTQFTGGFFDSSWRVGAAQEFATNTWVQMSVTWNGTDIKIYINGSWADTITYSGQTAISTGLGYNIGKRWDNPDYVTGDLGEIRIDGVALTDAQISSYYNATSGNYP